MLADNQKPTVPAAPTDPVILFDYQGSVSTVTLNRPKVLNAISFEMIQSLRAELEKWNENPDIKAVLFKGNGGRAFSSGGDLLGVYNAKQSQAPDAKEFPRKVFAETYTLDFLLANMKPTQIVFWDGIVMGGGAGISVHAPIRIATENAIFAMPEAKIGLFTDVGAGYFLTRLRNHLGYFLAFTAAQLKGQELVQAGVADFFVKRENLGKLEQEITQNTNQDTTVEDLRQIVRKYEEPVDGNYPNEELIDKFFGKESIEEIYKALRDSEVNKEFTQNILGMIDMLSPMSLRIISEQLRRGKELDFRENLKMDMRLMMRILDLPDAAEGVRCVVVTKGATPNWYYKSVFDVPQEEVEKNFEKLDSDVEILG